MTWLRRRATDYAARRASAAIRAMGDTMAEAAVEPWGTLRREILDLEFAVHNLRANFWLAVAADLQRQGWAER